MNRGFTVVELLVTLVVMSILLTLGTVGLRSSLANGRDAERKADIDTIARGFEQYYNRGNPYYLAGETRGSYPGTEMFVSLDGTGWCTGSLTPDSTQAAKYSVCRRYWTDALPGVSEAALSPPGSGSTTFVNPRGQTEANMSSWINQQITNGNYVYEPLNTDGTQCTSDTTCVRYALFYKNETSGAIITVRSKHE